MAPPKLKIDWDQFDKLCAIKCTRDEIANILEISHDTLERACKRDKQCSYASYYEKKASKGVASLRRRQYQLAQDGNVTMLIWLGKQYLGQSDKLEQKTESTHTVSEEVQELLKWLEQVEGKK